MTKKGVLSAVVLIFVGIVFGVLLVSNFRSGVQPVFAGDPQVKLGAPSQVKSTNGDYRAFSRQFIEVSKAVTPTVVTIIVTTKAKTRSGDLNDFFHFFGPDTKVPQPEPEQGEGSGVVISPDGYILTNNHVVEDADEKGIEVVFKDQNRMHAKLIGTDPTTDLAVIKVDGSNLPTAAFGNSDNLEVGEWVLAIGNPLRLQSTVTAGIVSAVGRGNIGVIADKLGYGIEDFIQTDAAINPGNSGGPLVNLDGEVIGINAAIATTNARYQGYGFAIPINLARAVAEDIIRNGKVRRGYLGVNIQQVDEAMAQALGLSKTQGVLIQNVVSGGAAEGAGIKAGDVILSVDGKPVNQPNEVQMYIARKHPGDEVSVKVYRDGKMMDKKITLRARKEETLAAKDEGDSSPSDEETTDQAKPEKSVAFDNLGLSVRSLSADDKKNNDVDHGVAVSSTKPYGEAYNHALLPGNIILEADRKEINSPKDLSSIIAKHKPGDAILMRVKRTDQSGNSVVAFVALQIPK